MGGDGSGVLSILAAALAAAGALYQAQQRQAAEREKEQRKADKTQAERERARLEGRLEEIARQVREIEQKNHAQDLAAERLTGELGHLRTQLDEAVSLLRYLAGLPPACATTGGE